MSVTRRQALIAVGVSLTYLKGKELSAGQAQQSRQHNQMLLVLDGIDDIVVQYQGQRVTVPTAEVVASLRGANAK